MKRAFSAAFAVVFLSWSLCAQTVKTVGGTAIANVKTINGVTKANVKTIQGVSVSAGSSYVTSVQNVSVTIAASATSGTTTITSVNTSLAAIFYGGRYTTLTTGGTSSARVELTNATTVTAYRGTADALTVTVSCTVVEFTSAAIQSIQNGYVSIGSTTQTGTATVTSVTTGNSVLIWLGASTTSASTDVRRWEAGVTLTNATTVTATFGNASGAGGNIGFCLVEFKTGIVQSAQAITATATASTATSYTATISSVTTGNTLLIAGGRQLGTNSAGIDGLYTSTLTNATTVTYTRTGTTSATVTHYTTVLEFVSGVLSSVQRGTISMAIAATSGTSTITSVDTSKAFATYQGAQQDVSTDVLTNATTVTATRGPSAAAAVAGWEVPAFN